MKKEYLVVTTLGLFALAYALDYFAGPVSISVKNPFVLGNTIDKYPFTTVGIIARSFAIMFSVTLILSLASSSFAKAIVAFFLAGLFELYAIQQLATASRMTTVQWTLSIAYGGLLLIIPIIYYLISGVVTGLHRSLTGEKQGEGKPEKTSSYLKSDDKN